MQNCVVEMKKTGIGILKLAYSPGAYSKIVVHVLDHIVNQLDVLFICSCVSMCVAFYSNFANIIVRTLPSSNLS